MFEKENLNDNEKNEKDLDLKKDFFSKWVEKIKNYFQMFSNNPKQIFIISYLYEKKKLLIFLGTLFFISSSFFILFIGLIYQVHIKTILSRVFFIGIIFFIFGGLIGICLNYFFPEFFEQENNEETRVDVVIQDELNFMNETQNVFKETSLENDISNSSQNQVLNTLLHQKEDDLKAKNEKNTNREDYIKDLYNDPKLLAEAIRSFLKDDEK